MELDVVKAINIAIDLMDQVPLNGSDSRMRGIVQKKLLEISEKAILVEKLLKKHEH